MENSEIKPAATSITPAQPPNGATPAAATQPTPAQGAKPTVNTPASEQPAKNWQEEYSKLEVAKKALEQSYSEARKKLQEQGSERNEYRKQFENLSAQQKAVMEAIAKFTNSQTYDPDKFMEELRTQGPDFLKRFQEDAVKAERERWQTELVNRDQRIEALEINNIIRERRSDSEKYPDFKKLESDMTKLYNTNSKYYDSFETLDERVDALYNQAVLQRSQDALKQAADLGRAKTEEELAREANAGVAGGGKSAGAPLPDPKTLTLEQLRATVAGQVGVTER